MPLVELPPGEGARAAPLFASFRLHRAHLGSVLAGANPGRVFVDEARSPRLALVWPGDGFQYLAAEGEPGPALAELSSLLAREAKGACLELVVDDPRLEARLPAIFGGLSYFSVPRLLFRLPPGWKASGPGGGDEAASGAAARGADAALSGASGPGAPARLFRERGPSSIAVVLELGGRMAGRCRAWTWEGEAEADIFVEEESRGHGLGALLGREFLRYCRDEGLEPVWSCWEDREESRRLALALGFELDRAFLVHIHDEVP